jgi:uncharacterized membrane protein YgdD (TMEM256/DUF423 family)
MYTLDHKMKRITHWALAAGTTCMLVSIVLEAYGPRIPEKDLLDIFEAGVQSQVYHGLGLILLGVVCMVKPYDKLFRWSTLLISVGVVLFSGSLYLIALMDTKIPALITPLGGLSLTAGWLTFTLGTLKKPDVID